MKKILSYLCLLITFQSYAQVEISPHTYNYGGVPLANQFYASFVVKNTGGQKNYLLKVEADNTIKYKKPTDAIPPGGSDTLHVWYNPENEGVFNKEVKVYFSDNPTPVSLFLKGNLLKLDKDPTLNCYSFSQKESGVNIILCDVKIKVEDATNGNPIEGAAVTQYFNSKPSFTLKANSEGMVSLSVKPDMYHYWIEATGYESIFVDHYINRETGQIVFKLAPVNKEKAPVAKTETKKPEPAKEEDTGELPASEYASNNIVFLIDISASMRRKDKLPLLKESMHTLIDGLRPIDKVSIITYADDARIMFPSKPVTDKAALKKRIDSLVANGATSVNRGVALAHKMVTDNYIDGGNNQIILATDGTFHIHDKDMDLFLKNDAQVHKHIMVTILGFGNDKDSLHQLKKLSSTLDGHYIYITDEDEAKDVLLKEIKKNSRRKK